MPKDLSSLIAAAIPFAEWEAKHFGGEPADSAVVAGDFRQLLFAPGGGTDPREFAADLGKIMAKNGLYMRAGMACYHDRRAGCLQQMTATTLPFFMLDHAKLVSASKNGPEPSVMSTDLAARILHAPQFLNALPEIARVSPVPLPVLRGGKLSVLPVGYSAQDKTMVLENIEWQEMSPQEAKRIIFEEWLGEFPFDASTPAQLARNRSVALAAMLAPFCELLVPAFHQRPAFTFTANREGSGKTLLARIALCPVHGKAKITPPPESKNENSLRQFLSSAARAGEPYIFFDNWRGKIQSGALEAFITANIWGDRVLGVSELFTAEKSCLVYITGNSAEVSPDIRRRSLFVELTIEEARSEDRVIKRRIDEDDIITDRARILSALLALVKDWHCSGSPAGSVEHGSFAKWGRVVGAIVEHATGTSPLLTAELKQGDKGLNAFEELMQLIMPPDCTKERIEITAANLLLASFSVPGFEWEDIDAIEDKKERDSALRKIRAAFGRLCTRFKGTKFGTIHFADNGAATRESRKYIITRKVSEVSNLAQQPQTP